MNVGVGQPRSLLTWIKGRGCHGGDPHLTVLLTQLFALFLMLTFLCVATSCASWQTGQNENTLLLQLKVNYFFFKLDEACGKFWSVPRCTTSPTLITGVILGFE